MADQRALPIDNLEIGTVIEVDGTHVIAQLAPNIAELSRVYNGVVYTIGQFGSIVKVHFGSRLIFGYVGRLRMKAEYDRERGLASDSDESARIIEFDLFGEGEWVNENHGQALRFERGVSNFPLPQQRVYLTPRSELRHIYGGAAETSILIGEYSASGGTPCYGDLNELLSKHTAILGSTGAGKSATVASILHSILDRHESNTGWQPQIIVFDPHNEYCAAFPQHRRLCTDEGSLSLPYWLLSLQETISLLVGKTEFVASSQANIVKTALLAARKEAADSLSIDPLAISVDSPIPYRLSRLVELIENDPSKPSAPSRQDKWNSVLHKLTSLREDARLNFLMEEWSGEGDPFSQVIEQFLGSGEPIRIVDLSAFPNEVAGIISSAVARTIFSIKLWQTREERENSPVLLVCEEAHRYVPNRGEAQYEAAQDAIRRVAKEGRKYGIGLMLVSQRPSEVESTVLSQCNSWVVMRITNEADRNHVRSILPDSLSGLTKILSGLRRREAIFLGLAAAMPSRILVRDLLKDGKHLPRSQDINFEAGWKSNASTRSQFVEISRRWRLQNRTPQP